MIINYQTQENSENTKNEYYYSWNTETNIVEIIWTEHNLQPSYPIPKRETQVFNIPFDEPDGIWFTENIKAILIARNSKIETK